MTSHTSIQLWIKTFPNKNEIRYHCKDITYIIVQSYRMQIFRISSFWGEDFLKFQPIRNANDSHVLKECRISVDDLTNITCTLSKILFHLEVSGDFFFNLFSFSKKQELTMVSILLVGSQQKSGMYTDFIEDIAVNSVLD